MIDHQLQSIINPDLEYYDSWDYTTTRPTWKQNKMVSLPYLVPLK